MKLSTHGEAPVDIVNYEEASRVDFCTSEYFYDDVETVIRNSDVEDGYDGLPISGDLISQMKAEIKAEEAQN
jgi:hypothetical protein